MKGWYISACGFDREYKLHRCKYCHTYETINNHYEREVVLPQQRFGMEIKGKLGTHSSGMFQVKDAWIYPKAGEQILVRRSPYEEFTAWDRVIVERVEDRAEEPFFFMSFV